MEELQNKTIKVGAVVNWSAGWGSEPPVKATIEAIDLCETEHEKYGLKVNEVWAIDKDRCCFTLTNGHWSYGDAISFLPESLTEAEI